MPLKENKIVKLNAIPKELREREHFVFLNDYTTGPCNFKRRAERRICDRLNSYCRAILEEHYSQITGHNIEPKALNYLINTVYPNARRFKGQKTVKIQTVDSSTNDKPTGAAYAVDANVCDKDGALTESQYRTFIGTKYDNMTAAVIFESDRKTHGGSLNTQTSQLTGVYDSNDNDVFSMLRQNWQINTFTTTFDVYEQHTDAANNKITYHKYSVKIVLKRVHKLFCDVWRFSDMTITEDKDTGADAFDGEAWEKKNLFDTWNLASYKKTSKKHKDNKKD